MGARVEDRMAKLIRAATDAGHPPRRVVVSRGGDVVLIFGDDRSDDYDTASLRR